jgi:DNA polymerase-1
MDRVLAEARERGFVSTMFGRRRPVPELSSKNAQTRQLGERLAMNSPIQGTAAEVIKLAMINISRRLGEGEGLRGRMILQVHDELVFECPAGERDALMGLVRQEMEGAVRLDVPLAVEMGSGDNWARAHP